MRGQQHHLQAVWLGQGLRQHAWQLQVGAQQLLKAEQGTESTADCSDSCACRRQRCASPRCWCLVHLAGASAPKALSSTPMTARFASVRRPVVAGPPARAPDGRSVCAPPSDTTSVRLAAVTAPQTMMSALLARIRWARAAMRARTRTAASGAVGAGHAQRICAQAAAARGRPPTLLPPPTHTHTCGWRQVHLQLHRHPGR